MLLMPCYHEHSLEMLIGKYRIFFISIYGEVLFIQTII